jgi:dTDP-4-dehydrorhamnose reductase
MSKRRFLIIGSDGLIGFALLNYLKKANESVISTTRKKLIKDHTRIYLNLKDEVRERKFLKSVGEVDTVVFCSGITQADKCEKDKFASRMVNVESVCKLAGILANNCRHIVFLSSNAVFDGSKEYPSHEDTVSPVNEYGRQKSEVEQELLKLYPSRVTILRLTKVLGARNPLFDDWSHMLKKGASIYPFSDMYIAPIPVSFVVSVIRLLVDRSVSGILHLSGDQDFSYADIAFMAASWLGAKKVQVKPILASESHLHRSLLRQSKTALDISRLQCELGIIPPKSLWTLQQAFVCPSILNGV